MISLGMKDAGVCVYVCVSSVAGEEGEGRMRERVREEDERGGMRRGGGGWGKRGEAELIEIRASRAAGSLLLLLLLGAQTEHAQLLEFFFSNELILLIQFRWRWKESRAASIKFSFLLTRPGLLCSHSVRLISDTCYILWPLFFPFFFGLLLLKSFVYKNQITATWKDISCMQYLRHFTLIC